MGDLARSECLSCASPFSFFSGRYSQRYLPENTNRYYYLRKRRPDIRVHRRNHRAASSSKDLTMSRLWTSGICPIDWTEPLRRLKHNQDEERLQRCDIHYLTPDLRITPFCSFNVIPGCIATPSSRSTVCRLRSGRRRTTRSSNPAAALDQAPQLHHFVPEFPTLPRISGAARSRLSMGRRTGGTALEFKCLGGLTNEPLRPKGADSNQGSADYSSTYSWSQFRVCTQIVSSRGNFFQCER